MIKFDQQERVTVDAIGRFAVLLLNGVAVAAAIVSGLLSGKEGIIRNHIAAAYCSTMSACVCTYFFQWGEISEGQWGTAEGVVFVSTFCASTSLVPAILFFQLRPGAERGDIAAFVLGLSSFVIMIVHTSVASLTLLRRMRKVKHQVPETEINFYKNAKEAIDECFSSESGVSCSCNPNSTPVPIVSTTNKELELDAFVVIE